MKKLLGIVVLGLLLSSKVNAETVLRCQIDPGWSNERVTLEVNFQKNQLAQYSHHIYLI